ncbi:MAG: hypothetical protein JKX74_00885, partial [Flavobacteriales bacterium]|nr:hypothetical protein [Flavobacteriales bacterium]
MNFKRTYISAAIIALLALGSINVNAQDIHFSQFSSSPLTLNPGHTGAFDGDVRAVI